MKRIKQIGAFLSLLFLTQLTFAQAGSTFTNPMIVSALPYVVTGDSTCGYGDNYTTADIACTGSYMSGDEKIYSFTPASNIASFNVEMTNISDSWSGMYITDDSTTSGNCLGNVGSSGTADRGIYNVSLVSGTTYYIIVSTWATPQCISSFDINMYSVSCPDPSSLSASNITYDSVSVSWTENGLATSWIIEWDTNGFVLGTGNTVISNSNPDTLSGLNPSTNYSYYVRAFCGVGDSSAWVGPYNFTTLPTCPAPTSLGVTNVTSVAADLGWTESGSALSWQVEWDTNGFTQGTGNINLSSSNPYSISGLTANTTYQFYVRSICGPADTSSWTGPFSFTSLCNVLIAPYSESFDATSIPGCWNQSSTTGGPWVFGNPGIPWNTSGCSAPTEHTGNSGNMASMDHSSTDVGVILELPVVDVTSLTIPNLTFWYYMCNSGYSPTNKLFVEAWNGTSWALVDSNVTGTSGWELQSFDVSSHTYATNLVWLRLRSESGGSTTDYYGDAGIDDVEINEAPNCLPPSNLTVANLLANSVDLGWTENGSATLWDVEYGISGFTQGTGTIDTTSSNPISISGLLAQTDYQFYVKAICGTGDSSAWVGPFAFTTPCATLVPQYFEPFNSFLPSVCWEQAGNGTPATGPTSIGSSSWSQSGFPGTGTGGTRVNLYSTGKQEWILTPVFDLSAGGYELKIETLIAAYSGGGVTPMGSDDSVQVLISNDAGATWNAIHTWDSLTAPGNVAGFEYIDLSAYTSATTQFAIWASEGTVNDPEDYYFYVGSFEIRDIPSCIEPIALNAPSVGSTSAEIGWTEQGTATTWETSYGAPGFTVGAGTQNVTTFNPDTLTGLAFNTGYEVYVRSVCGAGDSSLWVGPVAISTLPDTISVFPYTNDLESGLGTYIGLGSDVQSSANVDTIANNASSYGIYMTGKTSSGWTGGSTSATETQAFVDNATHISSVDMVVDASALTSLILNFDMRQSYTYGPKYSWGRVTVNGTQVGVSINPATANADTFMTVSIDLTAYVGSVFNLSIEHSGKYDSTNYSNSYGDDASIDNIVLYSPVMATAAVDSNVSCYGMSNGGATVTATEGFAPYTYLWSNSETTASITGVTAGVYSVTVYDADGDTATASVTITEPMPVVVNLGNDTSLCMGDSVIFNAGTFSAYLWDDASTMAMRTAYATVAGPSSYWVEVTDTNGCTGSDTVVVTTNAPINPDLGVDTAICFSGSVTLDAGTGFSSYSWDDATSMQTRLVDGATEGAGVHVYFVSTVDMNGCNGSDTINVTVDAEIMVDLGNDTTVCNGEKITLDAGVYSSYMWDDNSTMQTRDVVVTTVGSTTYDVTVMTAVGCTGNSSITITGLAPVIVDLGSDTSIIWFGSDTIYTLDAGAGFTGYLWSDGTTNQTNDITLANSGNVIVVVTDANGCTGSDTVLVDFVLSVPTFEVASLKMYPNPADNQVNIELSNFKNVNSVNITFLSITGKVVLTKNVQVNGNSYFESFDVSSLATGTYFVQFEANGEVITKQFVIK